MIMKDRVTKRLMNEVAVPLGPGLYLIRSSPKYASKLVKTASLRSSTVVDMIWYRNARVKQILSGVSMYEMNSRND